MYTDRVILVVAARGGEVGHIGDEYLRDAVFIFVDILAPVQLGDYYSYWCLEFPDGKGKTVD